MTTLSVGLQGRVLSSPQAYLDTLEAYLETWSVNKAARKLGVSTATVHSRLTILGVRFERGGRLRVIQANPDGFFELRLEQLRAAATERAAGQLLLTPDAARELLVTLRLYRLHQNLTAAGSVLGLTAGAIRARLNSLGITLRPAGRAFNNVRVEDVNEPGSLDVLEARLAELAGRD